MWESKYQYLIKKSEEIGLKHFKDPKAFMEYSNDMNYIYNSIEEYNSMKERKELIVFDDMIADIVNEKKPSFNSD